MVYSGGKWQFMMWGGGLAAKGGVVMAKSHRGWVSYIDNGDRKGGGWRKKKGK